MQRHNATIGFNTRFNARINAGLVDTAIRHLDDAGYSPLFFSRSLQEDAPNAFDRCQEATWRRAVPGCAVENPQRRLLP